MAKRKTKSDTSEAEKPFIAPTLADAIAAAVAEELDLEEELKARIERRVADILSRRYDPGDVVTAAAFNSLFGRLDHLESTVKVVWACLNAIVDMPPPPPEPPSLNSPVKRRD